MFAKQIDCVATSLILILCFMASAKAASFFVDQGHTDVVDGVAFEIVPPQLFIKKAFKLRDENLTTAQLVAIREAMPAIASMTQNILNRPSLIKAEAQLFPVPRSIYQLQHIENPTQLFIQTLKNWQVTETSIQFSSDYFYTHSRGRVVNFRDTYVFEKTAQGWQFLKHPYSAPDGVLTCKKSPDDWMRCELPTQP